MDENATAWEKSTDVNEVNIPTSHLFHSVITHTHAHWLWDKDHCYGSTSRYRASWGTEIPAQQEGMLGKSHQSPAWQLEVNCSTSTQLKGAY